MSHIEIHDLNDAPSFVEKCYKRVTQDMIHCPVLIVSRNQLEQPHTLVPFTEFPWDRYEREAKHYYQSNGFEVIRLEHFASTGVGDKEDIFPKSKILGKHLRKYFSSDDYNKYLFKSKAVKEALVLNGIYPKDYSISFYPPDFLVVNAENKTWKFVEVKGPTDKLRFRQANWYINLMPKQWEYEIFASINRKLDDSYICDIAATREGEVFKREYTNEIIEVDKWNTMMKSKKKR